MGRSSINSRAGTKGAVSEVGMLVEVAGSSSMENPEVTISFTVYDKKNETLNPVAVLDLALYEAVCKRNRNFRVPDQSKECLEWQNIFFHPFCTLWYKKCAVLKLVPKLKKGEVVSNATFAGLANEGDFFQNAMREAGLLPD